MDKIDAWEIYKHADNLYHQRINFFLVAESMLVVSFATALNLKNSNTILIPITLLGMVFTISWLCVNKGIGCRMNYLQEKHLKPCNKLYEEYLECIKWCQTIPSSFFMTYLLPFATFAFWCYLLYYTLVLL